MKSLELPKFIDSFTYFEGMKLFSQGKIVDSTVDEYDDEYGDTYLKMEAVVLVGRETFTPSMTFDFEGIYDYSCSCCKKGKICPHIVALFFEAQNFVNKEFQNYFGFDTILPFDIQNTKKSPDQMFLDYFLEEEKEKNVISLEIEPTVNGFDNNLKFDMSIVTSNKKYKLNSKLGIFLSNYEKEPMEFGKFYTYNPNKDIFLGWDKNFIDTIKTFYVITEYANVPLENFMIDENLAEKVMLLLEESPYVHIEKTSLKTLLKIKAKKVDKDNIEITLENINDIYLIGKSFVYTKKNIMTPEIYHITPQEQNNLKKLIDIYYYSDKNKLTISEETFQKKASILNSFTSLSLCKELQEKIYVPKTVEGAVYLDEDIGTSISVQLKKTYDGVPESQVEKLVLENNFDIENEFLSIMSPYNSYKDGKRYVIFEGEDIFNFVTNTVPQLQKKYSVFYSEKLKKRKYKTLSYNVSAKVTDLLELNFSIEDISPEELKELFAAIENKKRYFFLKDGGILDIQYSEELEKVKEMLDICQATSEEIQSGSLKRDKNYGYFIANMIKKIENISYDEKIAAMQKDLKSIKNGINEDSLKDFTMLRDYQKKGVQWLLLLKKLGLGGILADDMGLGKTLQVIAYLSLMEKSDKINLIVVPKTLLYNWQNEFKKFAPHMQVKLVAGTPNVRKYIIEDAEAGDTLITTYGMLSHDVEFYNQKDIDVIVIDEAQNIKNFLGKTTNAVKQIKSDVRIALTGTPIENNTMELWSIFDFVFPGYLGKHSVFKNRYMDNLDKLREIISPFILRRTKSMVLKELPEKIENCIEVELEPAQKKLYQTFLAKYKENFSSEEENSIELLACITRLRQICNHPKLFIEDYKGKSSKLEALIELLKECQSGGHRVLLFSQFTEMLKLIENELPKDIKYLYLDGKTKPEERAKLVEQFNNGNEELFLISLKAGGSGLNLTGADTVIHFDPWWNPSIEDQASDRAHRLGQEKIVNVFRLIARGTIEEKIETIKKEKRNLIKQVIEGERKDLLSMTKQDILDLLMKK